MLGNNFESRHTHRVFPTTQLQFLNVAILFEEPFEFFVVSVALFEAATLRQVQMRPNHWVRCSHFFPFLAYPLSSHQERHRAIVVRTIPENSFPNFLVQFLQRAWNSGSGSGSGSSILGGEGGSGSSLMGEKGGGTGLTATSGLISMGSGLTSAGSALKTGGGGSLEDGGKGLTSPALFVLGLLGRRILRKLLAPV